MKRWTRIVVAVLACVAVFSAWIQLLSPGSAGSRIDVKSAGVPVTVLLPDQEHWEPPYHGVIVAHGFAGSRRMMLGYGYSLVSAGYAVALPDFSGHGSNATLLSRTDTEQRPLQRDIDAARDVLLNRSEVDGGQLSIVGHSMGSGAALQVAIAEPERYGAVVAVSPTDAPVTNAVPRDLLLQAGAWEPRFADNARRLLAAAGGPSDSGNRRKLEVIPNVEHITIVFSPASQHSAVRWIGESLATPTPAEYRDRRLLWYGILIAGTIALMMATAPLLQRLTPSRPDRGARALPALRGSRSELFMVLSPFLAGAVTGTGAWVLARTTGAPPTILGLSVGGFVGLWTLFMGGIWLAVGIRPAAPRVRSLLLGCASFVVLWANVGLAGQHVLFQWVLVPYRLLRWPVLALWAFPWLLCAGYLHASATTRQRIGIYFGQTVSIVAVLALHGLFVPGLFFLVLLLPLLPVVLLVMQTTGGSWRDPWAYATGNALFFGWLLSAVFPLQ